MNFPIQKSDSAGQTTYLKAFKCQCVLPIDPLFDIKSLSFEHNHKCVWWRCSSASSSPCWWRWLGCCQCVCVCFGVYLGSASYRQTTACNLVWFQTSHLSKSAYILLPEACFSSAALSFSLPSILFIKISLSLISSFLSFYNLDANSFAVNFPTVCDPRLFLLCVALSWQKRMASSNPWVNLTVAQGRKKVWLVIHLWRSSEWEINIRSDPMQRNAEQMSELVTGNDQVKRRKRKDWP